MAEQKISRSGSWQYRLLTVCKFSIVSAIIIAGIFWLNSFRHYIQFPIKTVRVYGTRHLEHKQIQTVLTPFVATNFFAVDVDNIRDRLMHLPWVADVIVRRVWPETVNVNIIEKNPVAYWNAKALLSDTGQIFVADQDPDIKSLPNLQGPLGKQIIVLQYYLQINQMMESISRKIVSLTLTPYLTWNITLDNGVELRVGHQQVLTRLSRFVKVYSKIIGSRASEIDYVDLRYSNGVAVKWKQSVKT